MSLRLLLGSVVAVGAAAAVFGPAVGQDKADKKTAGVIVGQRGRVILADEATLASDRPGIVKFVEPEEGDRVKAGQKVAALKDEVAAAALAVAEETAKNDVEVRFAQKSSDVAKVEYERALEANRKSANNIPEIEILRYKLSYERAKLQIEKAQFDREVAFRQRDEKAAELATYQITAPFDGVVTRVLKQEGEAVQQGDPILQVVKTDVVRVEGWVDVAEAFRVKPGDAVRVRIDLPGLPERARGRLFEGKVGFIDVTVNPVTKQIRVWASVPNEGNLLKAGLPVAMEIAPSGETASADAAGARQ